MNINQKFIINIISIVNSIIAIILLIVPFIISKGPYGEIDLEFLEALSILMTILISPVLILQIIKFLFIKLNWNMQICLIICVVLEQIFLLMYILYALMLTISPTEPY